MHVRLCQGCYKVVTRLLQGCYNLVFFIWGELQETVGSRSHIMVQRSEIPERYVSGHRRSQVKNCGGPAGYIQKEFLA